MGKSNNVASHLGWLLWVLMAAALSLPLGLLLGCDKPLPPGGVDRTKMVTELEQERTTLVSLGNALRDGTEQLADQKYPNELIAQLDSIDIPAPDFSGHDVSRLPPTVVDALLSYGGELRVLAKKKKRLKGLLQMAKPQVEAYFENRDKPAIPFSVLIEMTDQGPRASLVKNKDPFVAAEPWPERYTVLRLEGGKAKPQEITRYQRGAIKDAVIPIDPSTTKGFTDERRVFMLRRSLLEIAVMVNGASTSTLPDDAGLVEANKKLVEVIKGLKVVVEPR